MTDRPASPPEDEIIRAFMSAVRRTNDMDEIVRMFASTLRQIRELETEKLWHSVYKAEFMPMG